jgi:hypothetical protein
MENQTSASKTMLTYGLYLGLSTIILSVANYSFGNPYKPHWIISVLNFVLFIGFIVYGIKVYKSLNGDLLRLGQALKVGIGIALIGGILSALYQWIFMTFIDADFMSKLLEVQEQVLYEKYPDMDEAIIEKQLEMMQKFSSPGVMIASNLAVSLFFGFIISLIAGLIMKKEETQF